MFHMCCFGMTAKDAYGEAPVYKPTRVATNSEVMAEMLDRKCCGGHRHVALLGGRAEVAGTCPQALCDAIVDGYLLEKAWRDEAQHITELNMFDLCDPADRVDQQVLVGQALCTETCSCQSLLPPH